MPFVSESQYILRGGEQGARRLKVLAAALRPTTFELLERAGLESGMQVLDVGCGNGEVTRELQRRVGPAGRVIGIDIDPTVLAVAEKQTDEQPRRIRYEQRDATNLNYNGDFDAVYGRFILTHLEQPQAVVKSLHRALRPGGRLILEDIEFRGHFCFPPCGAFERYVELYEAATRHRGIDAHIGIKLSTMAQDAGFVDVSVRSVTPAFHQGPGKQIGYLTLKQIGPYLISAALAEQEEIDELLDELVAYSENPRTLMSISQVVQVIAKH